MRERGLQRRNLGQVYKDIHEINCNKKGLCVTKTSIFLHHRYRQHYPDSGAACTASVAWEANPSDLINTLLKCRCITKNSPPDNSHRFSTSIGGIVEAIGGSPPRVSQQESFFTPLRFVNKWFAFKANLEILKLCVGSLNGGSNICTSGWMNEGETDRWMGGQWVERERGGGGSLDGSQPLKGCISLLLWWSPDWRSNPSNEEPSTFDKEKIKPACFIAFSTMDSTQDWSCIYTFQ